MKQQGEWRLLKGRRALNKSTAREARRQHKLMMRWRDRHDRSWPFERRKRWRFMPPIPQEFRLIWAGNVRSSYPGVNMTIAL